MGVKHRVKVSTINPCTHSLTHKHDPLHVFTCRHASSVRLLVNGKETDEKLIDKDFNNLPFALLKVNVIFVRRPFRNKANACFCSQISERSSYYFAKIDSYMNIKDIRDSRGNSSV